MAHLLKTWETVGSGTVGRAVVSDTRDPRVKSSHRHILSTIFIKLYWKDENKQKRGWELPIFRSNKWLGMFGLVVKEGDTGLWLLKVVSSSPKQIIVYIFGVTFDQTNMMMWVDNIGNIEKVFLVLRILLRTSALCFYVCITTVSAII